MTHTDNSGEEGSLGLNADKRAEEYFSKQQAELKSSKLDPEVGKGVDDFFDAFERIYLGDSEFDEAFGPRTKPDFPRSHCGFLKRYRPYVFHSNLDPGSWKN